MTEQQSSVEQTDTGSLVTSASEGVQQGATDAVAAATEAAGSVSAFLSKAVYNSCYYTSYYVTFGAMTVAKLLPLNNAAGHGLADGAAAARHALHKADEQIAARVEAAAVQAEAMVPA